MTEKHDSRADIAAILAARRSAIVEVQRIPALPVPGPKPTTQPAPQAAPVQAQSVPITQPAATPVVQAAPTPQVSDRDVEVFLGEHLPALIQAAKDLATPPFQFGEVVQLGTVVSKAVADGLPQVQGLEARTLVVVIVRYVWRTYATPLLPPTARPFAGLLETLIVAGIEAAYQLAVKRRK